MIVPLSVDAIVMRHDRDDQAFIKLARKFPATVTFYNSEGRAGFAGMGTLVDSRWVLTAAHVAEHFKPDAVGELGGATYQIDSIIIHPDWQGFKTWAGMRADIALIRLSTAVTNVVPAELYTGSDEMAMSATIVGMGRIGTGLTGPVADTSTLRAATNLVEKAEGSYLRFRFDAPDDRDVTSLEGICGDGDSGNPAFIERSGVTYLIGVGSAQDARPTDGKEGRYGVLEYYPRVSYFAAWIQATIRARDQLGPASEGLSVPRPLGTKR
jgi:hypothetical protein